MGICGSVALGSRSFLAWFFTSGVGVDPRGQDYTTLPLIREDLSENITFGESAIIPKDRASKKLVDGYYTSQGSIQNDFDPFYFKELFGHLLQDASITTALGVPFYSGPGAFAMGTYVREGVNMYVVQRGGTVTTVGIVLDHTAGTRDVDGVIFKFVSSTLISKGFDQLTGPGPVPGFLSILKVIDEGKDLLEVLFTDCRIDRATLQLDQGNIMTTTWHVVAIEAEDVTIEAPPVAANYIQPFRQDRVVSYDVVMKVDGLDQVCVKSLSLDINNNILKNVFTLGNRYRTSLPYMEFIVSGAMEIYLTDDKQAYDLFHDELFFDVRLQMIAGDGFVDIHLPDCRFSQGTRTPTIQGNGVIIESYQFRAIKRSQAYAIKLETTRPV